MSISDLPAINALLNSISTVFLTIGFVHIKRGDRVKHKQFMLSALISSGAFLICYLFYHYNVGSVPYPQHWSKTIYLIILVPHIILAGIMTPFIILAVWRALREDFDKHKKIVRWVFPVWMYVSFTGVVIYLMLYWIAPGLG